MIGNEEFGAKGADDREDGKRVAQPVSRDRDLIEPSRLDGFGGAQPVVDQVSSRNPGRDAAPEREQQSDGRDRRQESQFQTDRLDGLPWFVCDVGGQDQRAYAYNGDD